MQGEGTGTAPRHDDRRYTILTLTEQAASIIRDLISQAASPQGAGLRIAQRQDHTSLVMTLADEPSPGDLIVADHEVAVFVGPMAGRRVQAQTLDANTTDTSTAFYLRD